MFWYTKQDMKVRWGNGVKQGGILSPVLFNIYMDKLSMTLNNTAIGGQIVASSLITCVTLMTCV